MPKDALIEVIQNQQHFLLLLIFSLYLLNWTVLLKLGLVINKFSIATKRLIFPWALIGAIYSLLGKQFITDYLFFFGSLLVLFLLLVKISKLEVAKVFLAAVISLLTGAFSILLFGQTTLMSSKFRTIMFSAKGAIIGSIFEAILPIFFLLIFSTKTRAKMKKGNTSPHIILNISLLFIIYCISTIVFYFLTNYHHSIFGQVLISEAILLGLTVYVLWRLRRLNLLKTILSKQREYRNCFQVIRAMAEGGKTQEIVAYIDNILDDISFVDDYKGLNPIFTACHVAEEIRAREKGVKITTKTRSALADLKEPLQVYAIFKDLLQYFVAYEETIVCDEHQIQVEVSEDEHNYIFKITRKKAVVETGEEPVNLDRDNPLRPIAKRIKKLHGKFYPFYKGDELIGCHFMVGKARRNQSLFPLNFGT